MFAVHGGAGGIGTFLILVFAVGGFSATQLAMQAVGVIVIGTWTVLATGVATATVTKRIRRLEDAGVIEEYRPQLDYAAVGYDVTALFHLDVAGQGLPEVVEELQDNERMIGVYEVTGSHDVVLDTVREYAQPPVERT